MNQPVQPIKIPDKLPSESRPRPSQVAFRAQSKPQVRTAIAHSRPPYPEVSESLDTLSDNDFHTTLEQWPGVKRCLSAHADRSTNENQGALRLALTISASGEVLETHVSDGCSDLARLIAPCIEKQATQIRFRAFDAPKPIQKEAKFVF